ncbi:ATP-binding protein [Salinimicrobium oceani]|uniref:histidine kinase n=1 Tax=Salinimicrobium oceani TaxID=2722702 RepID=A0ABX1D4P3_9FLAO|nr:ATP-binding protein [Salinimicrobium oceani]NJW55042.1 sensor histidine kinase [Salinimicrobium oceani]
MAGTGMGLYIVKRMIESQEGRIKMESTPGEGTLFKVFFQAPFQAKKSG